MIRYVDGSVMVSVVKSVVSLKVGSVISSVSWFVVLSGVLIFVSLTLSARVGSVDGSVIPFVAKFGLFIIGSVVSFVGLLSYLELVYLRVWYMNEAIFSTELIYWYHDILNMKRASQLFLIKYIIHSDIWNLLQQVYYSMITIWNTWLASTF